MQKIQQWVIIMVLRTGKKSRTKKLDAKQLRANFKAKKDITTPRLVKESNEFWWLL